jgi:hypothetical protein
MNTMNDNKTEAIVLRVDQKLKLALQKLADADNRQLSDYVRLQLRKLVEETNKAPVSPPCIGPLLINLVSKELSILKQYASTVMGCP